MRDPRISDRSWRRLAKCRCGATALSLTLFSNVSAKATYSACVNIAEIERGLRPAERKQAQVLLDRLTFFDTTREAATRAGRYQVDWARRGRTLHTPDALIAGTARAHSAVLVTDNLDDFPMRDIRVESLAAG